VNSPYLRLAVAWLVSVCIGCASARVRYYTLVSPPEQTLPVPETTLAIDVQIVHIPPQLKRAELMARTGTIEVTLLENERWASPVNDEIKDALRLELQRRQDRLTGLRAAFTKLTIDIDVHHFDAELGKYALFEVSWRAVLSATGAQSTVARATRCTFRADEKIGTGYAGMVEGYQREIAALAEAIVAVLTSPANGLDASCH
jgi:uncharacterized lipoprotein YmbA